MIKLNFKDGSTLEFDLNKEDDLQLWGEWSIQDDFQNRITGIGVVHSKNLHTIPWPVWDKYWGKKWYDKVRFNAELVYHRKSGKLQGEKVSIHVNELLIELLVYTYTDPKPPVATKFNVRRIGKHRGPYMKPSKKGKRNGQ